MIAPKVIGIAAVCAAVLVFAVVLLVTTLVHSAQPNVQRSSPVENTSSQGVDNSLEATSSAILNAPSTGAPAAIDGGEAPAPPSQPNPIIALEKCRVSAEAYARADAQSQLNIGIQNAEAAGDEQQATMYMLENPDQVASYEPDYENAYAACVEALK